MAEYKQYAKLGSIEFTPLNGFNTFNKKGSSNYAEHQLLNSKNKLQPTGENLKEIRLSMRLLAHAMGQTETDFTPIVGIEQRLIMLDAYKRFNTAVELIWGNGSSEGYYVITSIEENVLKQFPDGTKMIVDVSVDLKEYYEPEPLKKEQIEARQAAPAVGPSKKSNSVNSKVNKKTCAQLVYEMASKLNMYAAAINTISIQYGVAYDLKKNANLIGHITKLKNIAHDFRQATTDPNSCLYNNAQLAAHCLDLENECDNFIADIKSLFIPSVLPNIQAHNQALQTATNYVKADLVPLIKTAISRNG